MVTQQDDQKPPRPCTELRRAALRNHVELSESPDECETFTQDIRLALGAVAEYGYRGLAVRGDAERRFIALKIAVIGQCVVGHDVHPGTVPYPATIPRGLETRLWRSIKHPRQQRRPSDAPSPVVVGPPDQIGRRRPNTGCPKA